MIRPLLISREYYRDYAGWGSGLTRDPPPSILNVRTTFGGYARAFETRVIRAPEFLIHARGKLQTRLPPTGEAVAGIRLKEGSVIT